MLVMLCYMQKGRYTVEHVMSLSILVNWTKEKHLYDFFWNHVTRWKFWWRFCNKNFLKIKNVKNVKSVTNKNVQRFNLWRWQSHFRNEKLTSRWHRRTLPANSNYRLNHVKLHHRYTQFPHIFYLFLVGESRLFRCIVAFLIIVPYKYS